MLWRRSTAPHAVNGRGAHIGAYSRYVHLAGGATMIEPSTIQPTAVRGALNRKLRLSAPICALALLEKGRAPKARGVHPLLKGRRSAEVDVWGPVEELPIWERLMPRAASPIKA